MAVRLVIGLLLFSGVARAYCSVDEGFGRARVGVSTALEMVVAPHAHQDGMADECPGLPNPDKEDAKPSLQWDGAAGNYGPSARPAAPAFSSTYPVARREPVTEPVFHRFPRLLN